jgi:S-adenosylmethionine decarboxylase
MINIGYSTFGRHIVADFWEVDFDMLNDAEWLEGLLVDASQEAGATVLDSTSYQFDPQGATAMVMLSESHVTIHTYPEHGSAMIDVFTCGETVDPKEIIDIIRERLRPKEVYMKKLVRGIGDIDVE